MSDGVYKFMIEFLQYCVYGSVYGILSYALLKFYKKLVRKNRGIKASKNWKDTAINVIGNIFGIGFFVLFAEMIVAPMIVIPLHNRMVGELYFGAIVVTLCIWIPSFLILMFVLTSDLEYD